MKYRLIDKTTGIETLCDKVTIDGFDYYVCDTPKVNDIIFYNNTIGKLVFTEDKGYDIEIGLGVSYPIYDPLNLVNKVIATTNPNIDIPKVVDEVDKWVTETTSELKDIHTIRTSKMCLKAGYNKSQETHPFSEEDMIEFAEWIADSKLHGYSKQLYEAMIRHKVSTTKELLQIWKEQRTKTVYHE